MRPLRLITRIAGRFVMIQIMPVHIARDSRGDMSLLFLKNTISGYDDLLCNQSGQDIIQLMGTSNNQNMDINNYMLILIM